MTNTNPQTELDWIPEPLTSRDSKYSKFVEFVSSRSGSDLSDYADLWQWSVDNLSEFWGAVWDFHGLPPRAADSVVLADDSMPGAVWFAGETINYAAEIFRGRNADDVAVVTVNEALETEEITWAQLQGQVASFAAALKAAGIEPGDRVVGYLPNCKEALIGQLGTVAIGAVWAVCGLDYPAPAALSRLSQLEPRVLVTSTSQTLAGQEKNRLGEVATLIAGLPSLEVVVSAGDAIATDGPRSVVWGEWIAEPAEFAPLAVPFDHPLWVLFSSGTTGTPKGIVHGHGGVALEYLKLTTTSSNMDSSDRLFWYTTPSWMMWNYLTSSLVSGASIVLYDGSPAYPTPDQIFQVGKHTGATIIGMSPAYLEGLRGKQVPIETYPELRLIGVTASVFGPETHHWVREQVGDNVHIASSSGGTDIVSGFAGAAPNLQTWFGELSGPTLGVALAAFDDAGGAVRDQVGELVVTKPMPSMPIRFWNDPDGARYRDAYFDTYPGVWRHGDWITFTSRGTVIIHGRSDATLNRFGVRMGSADIYGPVESLPEVAEALVLGVEGADGEYWMPLFVTLAPGVTFDDELTEKIKLAIRTGASPRHLPDEIIEAPAIPHTRTGKKLEVPLKKLMRGADPANVVDYEAVDSPEALDWFIAYAKTRA